MLYFSRFARNDILVAVWTLGLVICMWRYIDEGKSRYLYIGAALLALLFATKETAYLVTATLGLFLALVVTSQNWRLVTRGIAAGEVSPPVAISRLIGRAWAVFARGMRLTGVSRPTGFLVLLITLTLPQWAASVSVFQDTPLLSWSNLVLASPVGGEAPIGAPARGGLVVATLLVLALLWLSVSLGFRWSRSAWWRCALIFYVVWGLLYSAFFTNLGGIGSGVWQSLGYWVVQQGEARGGQPWYYHFLIASVYEFLPLLFAAIGSVYYLKKKDPFGLFLVFWAAITFILYTVASEKMPWLLLSITLPLIVLAGRFFEDAISGIQWRRLASGGGLLLLAGLPIFLVLSWNLAFAGMDGVETADILLILALVVVLLALAASGFFVARRVGYRNFAAFATIPLAVVLLVLSVRAGWFASYRNGDNAVEMIVYTQTTPELARLARHLQQMSDAPDDQAKQLITIDGTSGFHWPWYWYMRGRDGIGYTSYDSAGLAVAPNSLAVLVHSTNLPSVEPLLLEEGFGEGVRVRHRWWFPENYRGLTLGKVLGSLPDRKSWRTAMDYWLYRKLSTDLGSEDAYLFASPEFQPPFVPEV